MSKPTPPGDTTAWHMTHTHTATTDTAVGHIKVDLCQQLLQHRHTCRADSPPLGCSCQRLPHCQWQSRSHCGHPAGQWNAAAVKGAARQRQHGMGSSVCVHCGWVHSDAAAPPRHALAAACMQRGDHSHAATHTPVLPPSYLPSTSPCTRTLTMPGSAATFASCFTAGRKPPCCARTHTRTRAPYKVQARGVRCACTANKQTRLALPGVAWCRLCFDVPDSQCC